MERNRDGRGFVYVVMFTTDATAFLAEIADDNTREFFLAHRDRYEREVHAPMRALAAALEVEFGPVRVLRPHRNRRFRPDAPPYRVDTGATARGDTLGVVLSASALTVTAGCRLFDPGQLRRYRAAVDDELARLLGGAETDTTRRLTGRPRGVPADHPHLDLLRLRGLQVVGAWPVGDWLGTREPLHRVRAAWREARPLLDWLDVHVGPADPVPARPRPAPRSRDRGGDGHAASVTAPKIVGTGT